MKNIIEKFLLKVKSDLPQILKDNLFGIYIYGSYTYGDFRPKSSDIDCVVVVNKKLKGKELNSLRKWYKNLLDENEQMAKRFETSYAAKGNLISVRMTKTPRFIRGKFTSRANSDANSPITWLNIRNSGITVLGPKPKEFVPEISDKMLRHALKNELNYIKQRPKRFFSKDWDKVYAVLTFCRILYTLKTRKIKSKMGAMEWALKNLPETYHPIISSAAKAFFESIDWESLDQPAPGDSERSKKEIIRFGKYVSSQLK